MMEDIYFIMQSKKECPPGLCLEEGQYILAGDFEDPVRKGFVVEKEISEDNAMQIILPIASVINEKYFVNEDGVIEERDPYCKHCNSHHFIRKGYNWKTICLEVGIFIRVKIKRYLCKRCRLNYQTEFPDLYEKYCTFSIKFKELVRKNIKYGYMSLRHIKRSIKLSMDVDISHESIRKFFKTTDSLYYRDDSFKPSGYYGFDSQWVKINKKWLYRLALFDLINNRPLAEAIEEKENYDIIKNFITKSISPKDRRAIVTDKGQDYEKIMDELNFDHQLCTFHLEKHLWELVNKEANKIAKKYRAQLKKENPNFSKTKLNKMRDEKKKEFKEEMGELIELFMAFKDQQTWKKAQNYIEMLKRELINFPDFLQEYIMKNFMPYYKKYIKFLTKEYKGKLDSTDNKLENYFGNTLSKHIKKIFRTKQGLFNFIFQRKNGWNENNKSALRT